MPDASRPARLGVDGCTRPLGRRPGPASGLAAQVTAPRPERRTSTGRIPSSNLTDGPVPIAASLRRGPGPTFAHESEAELARILDFYEVRWEYEPHVFPILWNLDGAVVESFAPDFYLPDFDLHVELTTLRQPLVRKKNRKLRRLRELYPDVRIKLFYARDFRALMLKFGKLGLADALSGSAGQMVPAASLLRLAVGPAEPGEPAEPGADGVVLPALPPHQPVPRPLGSRSAGPQAARQARRGAKATRPVEL